MAHIWLIKFFQNMKKKLVSFLHKNTKELFPQPNIQDIQKEWDHLSLKVRTF